MNERTLAEWAEEYARMGYLVFPCNGEKKPMTKHGFKDASRDPGEVAAWWEDHPNANIGIATEGVFVVDIDPMDDGTANPWLDDQPADLANTPVAKTPRGGQHHWFRQPADADLRNSTSKLGEKVDQRANGGYVVVPPSVVNGQSYQWLRPLVPREQLAEVPAWLLELLQDKPRQTQPIAPRSLYPHEVEERASKYVANCPEAVSGRRGHSSTYAVATYLVHGFCLSADVAFRIIKSEYSPRCQPPWDDDDDIWHKVNDAASKSHDRPYGWLLNAERSREPDLVDLSNLFRKSPCIVDDSRAPDPGPFPSELLYVPGFISMVVEHNLLTAHKPQPLLALAGAIELQAVLAARKVRDERDNRTNIYSVGVAKSGAGKDHARKINKKILAAIGADKLEADGLASDAGLFTTVHSNPGILFQIDEFGKFLRTLSDARKAPHLYAIIEALLRLYSSADSSCKGKAYSDAAKNRPIEQPCVSLYATTTPDQFYESLTSDMATDGFIARLLVFESEDRSVRQRTVAQKVTEEICETARWWFEFKPGGNLSGINPEPRMIAADDEAVAVFDRLAARVEVESEKKRLGDSLWARCEEKACRLALIYACSANREAPVINKAAAEWACQLSEYLTKRLLWITGQWVSVNHYEALQKKITRIIRDCGGSISQTDLGQRTRFLSRRQRQELLADMTETGLITCTPIETDGRKATLISLT